MLRKHLDESCQRHNIVYCLLQEYNCSTILHLVAFICFSLFMLSYRQSSHFRPFCNHLLWLKYYSFEQQQKIQAHKCCSASIAWRMVAREWLMNLTRCASTRSPLIKHTTAANVGACLKEPSPQLSS